MRSVWAIVLTILLLSQAVVLSTSSAQEEQRLTTTNNTIWAHTTNEPECCESWMSPLQEDPRSTGSAPGRNPLLGNSWDLTLEPGLDGTIELDPDGTIIMVAYVGGSSAQGSVEVTPRLLHGEETVAEGDTRELLVEPAGDGEYERLDWELDVQLTTLEPGQDLTWIVEVEGAAVSVGVGVPGTSVFMGMSENRGHSHLVLPILSVEGDDALETIYALHEDDILEIEASSDETRARLNVHNWTQGPADVEIAFSSEIENGTLTLTITDSENETLELPEAFPDQITESIEAAANLTALAPGQWTIEILEEDFIGTYRLTAQVLQAEENEETDEEGEDDGTGEVTGSDGNETAGPEESSSLPGPAIILVLAVTGLGVALLRGRGRAHR